MDQLTIPDSERLTNLEDTIERGLKTFIEVGNALMEIRDSRLYRLQYDTFEGYCQERWGFTRMRASQLIAAAEVAQNVNNCLQIPTNESQTRPLTKLSSDQQREIWPVVVDTAPNGKITAAHVQKVIDDTYGKDEHLDAALNDETLPACEQCGQVYDGPTCPDCRPYNYLRDNRRSTVQDIYTPQGMDACQTPPYALDPLLPYLEPEWIIWEPATGEGYLTGALYDAGQKVEESDILTGQNFFDHEPDRWDALVTNPPYSIQFPWLERCYQLGKPFALLLKVEALGTKQAQDLMQQYGFEILLLNRRIDFKMPFKGWNSSAQFPVFWLCYGMLPKPVMFGDVAKVDMELTTAGGAL